MTDEQQIVLSYLDGYVGLTNYEYITIVASLKKDFEETFQCDHPDKFKDVQNKEEYIKIYKKEMFCDKQITPDKLSLDYYFKGMWLHTCPCSLASPVINTFIQANEEIEKNGYQAIFPNESFMDVPAKFIEAINVIGPYMNNFRKKIEDKQYDEMEKKLKK